LKQLPPRRIAAQRQTWDWLGRHDPLWSILSNPAKRENRWSEAEFFATGDADVEAVLAECNGAGAAFSRGRALDFGCGVGRLTQALCKHFEEVVGVDVAPSMIELANRYNRHPERCSYLLNVEPGLAAIGSASFDFVVSLLTLQHIPSQWARRCVSELVRILAPGGMLVFQAPHGEVCPKYWKRAKTSVRRAALAILPFRLGHRLQQLVTGQYAVIEMHALERVVAMAEIERAGGRVLRIIEDRCSGADWISYRYFVTRGAAPGA